MTEQQRTFSLQITLKSGMSFVYSKLTFEQCLDTITCYGKDLVEYFSTEDTCDV